MNFASNSNNLDLKGIFHPCCSASSYNQHLYNRQYTLILKTPLFDGRLTTGGGCETRMENEVIDKIRVLFDGFQQHEEKLDRIEQKVDAISVSISCRTLLALSLTEGAPY